MARSKMAKRAAKSQLTKHNMDMSDGSGSDGEIDDSQENSQLSELSQRVISQPKFRLGVAALSDDSKPTLSTLFNKTEASKTGSVGGENPWIKVRGLNASFLKSIQAEIGKDPLADFGKFFGQYLKYWKQLVEAHPAEIKPSRFEQETKPKVDANPPPQFNFSLPPVAAPPASAAKPFSFPSTAPNQSTPPATAPVVAPFKFDLPKPQPVDLSSMEAEKPKPFAGGFSFGASNSQGNNGATAKPASAFSFSLNPPAPMTAFGLMSPGQTQSQGKEANGDDAGADADDEPLEPAQIGLIRTGAGEEDEECLSESRVKLFIFAKESGWVDLGVGFFKVNRRKETAPTPGPNRILCRSEVSGAVLLNSAITKDGTKVDWEAGKKELKVTCVNQEGKLASYLVRTKEIAQAQQLNDAIKQLAC